MPDVDDRQTRHAASGWRWTTDGWWLLFLAAAAFVLSYNAQYAFARGNGWSEFGAHVIPLVLDGLAVYAALDALRCARQRNLRRTLYLWQVVVATTGASATIQFFGAKDVSLAGQLLHAVPPLAGLLAFEIGIRASAPSAPDALTWREVGMVVRQRRKGRRQLLLAAVSRVPIDPAALVAEILEVDVDRVIAAVREGPQLGAGGAPRAELAGELTGAAAGRPALPARSGPGGPSADTKTSTDTGTVGVGGAARVGQPTDTASQATADTLPAPSASRQAPGPGDRTRQPARQEAGSTGHRRLSCADRQDAIVAAWRATPGITNAALAAQFGTTERTIERDVKALRQRGVHRLQAVNS